MIFLGTPEVISVNLTVSGINETTFAADKSVFESVIADITNSSASTVEAKFLEMLSSITTRDVISRGEISHARLGRTNGNRALINLAVQPRDTPHEAFALSKMSTSITFREEVNSGLQGHHTESNPSVTSVSEIARMAGERTYVKLLYSLLVPNEVLDREHISIINYH